MKMVLRLKLLEFRPGTRWGAYSAPSNLFADVIGYNSRKVPY